MDNQTYFIRSTNCGWDYNKAEIIVTIFSPRKVYVLDGVSRALWEKLEMPCNAIELSKHITTNYEVDEKTALMDVKNFLKKALEENLLIKYKKIHGYVP
jgi:hypothetical protein